MKNNSLPLGVLPWLILSILCIWASCLSSWIRDLDQNKQIDDLQHRCSQAEQRLSTLENVVFPNTSKVRWLDGTLVDRDQIKLTIEEVEEPTGYAPAPPTTFPEEEK